MCFSGPSQSHLRAVLSLLLPPGSWLGRGWWEPPLSNRRPFFPTITASSQLPPFTEVYLDDTVLKHAPPRSSIGTGRNDGVSRQWLCRTGVLGGVLCRTGVLNDLDSTLGSCAHCVHGKLALFPTHKGVWRGSEEKETWRRTVGRWRGRLPQRCREHENRAVGRKALRLGCCLRPQCMPLKASVWPWTSPAV